MERTDPEYRKNRKYAALGVVVFSAGVMALLLLLGLRYQEPPPDEMGVEVNLGNSPEGSGAVQPEIPAETPQSAPPAAQQSQEQFVTQSTEPAPVSNPRVQTQQTQQEPQPDPQPTLDPRLDYSRHQSTGGSQGTGNTNADQGQPGGDPNSTNYQGAPGSGGGFSIKANLSGRSPRDLTEPNKNFTETGVVVVKIWVDRNGKVTRALAGAPGTTTSSATLRKLAEEAAKKSTFSANPDADVEQVGTIEYRFTLK